MENTNISKILKALNDADKAIKKEISSREKGGVSLEASKVQSVVKLKLAQGDILSAITLVKEA